MHRPSRRLVDPLAPALSLALCVTGMAACGEDPLALEVAGGADAGPAAGASGGGGDSGGDGGRTSTGGAQAEPADPAAFDVERLQREILPILERGCGQPICHGRAVRDDEHFQFHVPVAMSSAEEVDADLAEIARWVETTAPENSPFLRWPLSQSGGEPDHPTPGPVYTPADADYQAVLAWIVDAVTPDEVDAGLPSPDASVPTPAGGGIPCTALPAPDRTRYDYVQFEAAVNPMLVRRCADAECHGTAGNAGGLWLRSPGDGCEVRWNFLTVQWFVDPTAPVESLLLRKPLEVSHGGREVFRGMTDEDYGLLKRWVEGGVTPPR
jgi:hypothetical protein